MPKYLSIEEVEDLIDQAVTKLRDEFEKRLDAELRNFEDKINRTGEWSPDY